MESRERIFVELGRLLAKSAGPLFGLRAVPVRNKGRMEAEEAEEAEEAKKRKSDHQEKTLGEGGGAECAAHSLVKLGSVKPIIGAMRGNFESPVA
jgi:hypothetical protein